MRKYLPLSIVLLAASVSVSAQTYTVIHHFGSQAGDPGVPSYPGTISQSRGGAMITTSFRIWPGGNVQALGPLTGDSRSGFTLATDGQYYGTTDSGGTSGLGTVFRMSQDGSVTTLHGFQPGNGSAIHPELPMTAPIQSVEGDFYGNTGAGANYASVYRITKTGEFTVLHTFLNGEGRAPYAPLVQGTDYNFYGTMAYGGSGDRGTIFRVSSSGVSKILLKFKSDCSNGCVPAGGLIQAKRWQLLRCHRRRWLYRLGCSVSIATGRYLHHPAQLYGWK